MSRLADGLYGLNPDAVALSDPAGSYTWRELDQILNHSVNALLAAGLEPGQRLAVFAENSAETAIAYLTGLLAGVSLIPVTFHLTARELAYILKHGNAGAVFAGPESAEVARAAADAAGVGLVVAWRAGRQDGITDWTTWLASAPDTEPPVDMVPQTYLFFTSGTTGTPKATLAPKETFSGGPSVAQMIQDWTRNPAMRHGGVSLGVGPLYHNGPQHIVRQLAAGTRIVVLGRFDARRTLEAIQTYRVTHVLMVPTHFQRLLALPAPERAHYDVSSLQVVSHTGSACPVPVKRAMIEWFGPILMEAYGGTESGSTNLITAAEWLEHPGSVGRTLPRFELQIIGSDGKMLGPNEVGQIYFRDLTGRGIVYEGDAERTAAAHRSEGVFTLGEIGYYDDDAYLYITDRAADMVVSGGVNIYPAEAEQALKQLPAVADVAVIAVPSPEMGEELKALVVLAPDVANPPSEAELIAFCRSQIATYKCPRSVDFATSLGRTQMGKLDKRALRAPYWPSERTIG
ncbi:MAG TPA: AMP-binding protein [Trebonia sp.]|jgi:acyl-CoA synthetase (AMP-forming)/AMP-acid ligase II|nr:AMP-binding protein [Trebonia sp.]